jgi:glucosamine kinase
MNIKTEVFVMDKTSLGLDVGGSATRWSFSRNGVLSNGETLGFSGHLAQPAVFEKATKALSAIATEIGKVGYVVAGVSGLSRDTEQAAQFEQMVQQIFGAKKLLVMSDIELATRAAFHDNDGILVYAGTGSIAAYLGEGEVLQTAGGKGVLIDDAGGGYWIAVAALRQILRSEDLRPGSGWSTQLGQCLALRLGGTDWPVVRNHFYGLDRGGVALLALAVGEAAEAGDAIALDVLRKAGLELSILAGQLMIRTGCRKIALAGRAASLHDVIFHEMQKALKAVSVTPLQLNASQTALNLAHDLHDLVH